MSLETDTTAHIQDNVSNSNEQTCAEIDTRASSKPDEAVKPSADNPPIKRRDGSYRPLDTDLVERLRKGVRDSRRRNPDYHKHEIEFWQEFGDKLPW